MITIYGASDDLVEVEGCEGADEFDTDQFRCNLVAPGATEQMRVTVWYETTGTWQIAVGQVDEAVPFPAWPLRFRQGTKGAESDYSVVLEVDAPAGTRLTEEK